MANEQNLPESTTGEEDLNIDTNEGDSVFVMTRDWPAPKAEGTDILNPLVEDDYAGVFKTVLEQHFPTEEELKPKDKKAGPADTAEDP